MCRLVQHASLFQTILSTLHKVLEQLVCIICTNGAGNSTQLKQSKVMPYTKRTGVGGFVFVLRVCLFWLANTLLIAPSTLGVSPLIKSQRGDSEAQNGYTFCMLLGPPASAAAA